MFFLFQFKCVYQAALQRQCHRAVAVQERAQGRFQAKRFQHLGMQIIDGAPQVPDNIVHILAQRLYVIRGD